MLKENVNIINERVLKSVGEYNYNEYILLTKGKEIDSILDSKNSVYEMYNYRHELLDKGIGQNIIANELKELLKNNNDINLKRSLEEVFLDYLTDNEFKIVKDMLIKHTDGWNFDRLLDIHKRHKYDRIFSLLTIKYNDWLKC